MSNKERPQTTEPESLAKSKSVPEVNEAPRTTVQSVIEWVKCNALKQCDIADIRRETTASLSDLRQASYLKTSGEKTQNSSSKPSRNRAQGRVETRTPGAADLRSLQALQGEVGAKSMTRKLLFWNNPDIRRDHGSFSSESDRKLWAKLMQMPEATREKHPLYRKLLEKKGDTIQLPTEYRINFARNLSELWEEKLGMSSKNTPLIEFHKNQIAPIIANSKRWEKMSIEVYEKEIGTDIRSIVTAAG